MQIFMPIQTNTFEDLPFPGREIIFKDILLGSLGPSQDAEKVQREMTDTYLCPEWDSNPLSQYSNGRR
jgi:hypothetical protein